MVAVEQEVIAHLLEMVPFLAVVLPEVFGSPTGSSSPCTEITEEVEVFAVNVAVLVQKVMRT